MSPKARDQTSELLRRLSPLLTARERAAAPSTEGELIAWVGRRTLLPRALLEQARHSETLRLGRYTITGRLGRGGMGAVLKAIDPRGPRDVAIKVLQGDASELLRARFEREAEALARLSHTGIVQLYAFEKQGGLAYLVLECVPGIPLERRIREVGPLDEVTGWSLLAQASDALACAERAGIIHRDLKPSNILWVESSDRYKLLDFGIARFQGAVQQLTAAGTTLGTPAYMSPEQAMGKALDARSDMYSLGLTLHQVLTSVVPFEGAVIGSMLTRRVDEDVPNVRTLREAISGQLDTLVAWLTRRDRDQRPSSWAAFRAQLEKAAPAAGYALPTAAAASVTRVEEFDASPTVDFKVVLAAPEPVQPPNLPSTIDELQPDAPTPSDMGPVALCEPAIGEVLGDYRLERVLGRGGMGIVYEAVKVRTGGRFAVKAVVVSGGAAGDRRRERFKREVEALRRLSHDNVVRVYAYGRKGPFDYYAMDLIDGQPLDELLADESVRLTRHQTLTLFIGICKAISHAHENGVTHRDLKPANVLVDAKLTPHVLDFGLAKISDETKQGLTRTGAFLGTPYYMSPEQFLDPKGVDMRMDIFSLGVVLYEMVVGRRPFEGDTAAEISYKIMREKPVRPTKANPKVERAFDAICLKALEKDPSRRYPSVEKLKRDVVRLRRGTAEAETLLQRIWGFFARWFAENRKGVIAGFVLATALYIPIAALIIHWLLAA